MRYFVPILVTFSVLISSCVRYPYENTDGIKSLQVQTKKIFSLSSFETPEAIGLRIDRDKEIEFLWIDTTGTIKDRRTILSSLLRKFDKLIWTANKELIAFNDFDDQIIKITSAGRDNYSVSDTLYTLSENEDVLYLGLIDQQAFLITILEESNRVFFRNLQKDPNFPDVYKSQIRGIQQTLKQNRIMGFSGHSHFFINVLRYPHDHHPLSAESDLRLFLKEDHIILNKEEAGVSYYQLFDLTEKTTKTLDFPIGLKPGYNVKHVTASSFYIDNKIFRISSSDEACELLSYSFISEDTLAYWYHRLESKKPNIFYDTCIRTFNGEILEERNPTLVEGKDELERFLKSLRWNSLLFRIVKGSSDTLHIQVGLVYDRDSEWGFPGGYNPVGFPTANYMINPNTFSTKYTQVDFYQDHFFKPTAMDASAFVKSKEFYKDFFKHQYPGLFTSLSTPSGIYYIWIDKQRGKLFFKNVSQ